MPPASATRFAPAVCMTATTERRQSCLQCSHVVCGCPLSLRSQMATHCWLSTMHRLVYIAPLCCFVLPFISPSPPSQIEARTMAHLARDERLLAIFNADHGTVRVVTHSLRASLKLRWQVGGAANTWCVLRVAQTDLYHLIASTIFGKPVNSITKDQRKQAKTVRNEVAVCCRDTAWLLTVCLCVCVLRLWLSGNAWHHVWAWWPRAKQEARD